LRRNFKKREEGVDVKERQWLAIRVGSELLEFLAQELPQSDRKMRLAACAFCHRVERFIGSRDFMKLLRLSEVSADDPASVHERALLQNRLWPAWRATVDTKPFYESTDFACESFLRAAESAPHRRLTNDVHYATWSAFSARDAVSAGRQGVRADLDEAAVQSDLVRDIFGNPFRPVTFDPRWRTSDVVGLAQAIYDDKAFERMPILGDALMDAGCEEEQIIAHCRGDGPHVRGCWVVDLVFGNE
jgi:hypothetical protein